MAASMKLRSARYAGAGRPGIPDRLIDAAELYDLANNLIEARSIVYRPMIFQIPRALQGHE
jgi:hypothetical protein